MDGQTEWANCNVGQILCMVVHPDQKDWVNRVDLTEFAINMSISEMTNYAPFELNSKFMLSMIKEICLDSTIPKGVKDFMHQALLNLAAAHNAIIEVADPELEKGALVYLSTKNLNLPKGRAHKLCPK
ncbi:hypothetical protein C0995_004956 [Termitomyces sp. Mi166|nr:hypothetical protein C0995_004956 [Termitomyces sp. Mi166\